MVTCKICLKKFKSLNSHIIHIHNITIKEYKDRYPNAILVCKEIKLKLRKANLGKKASDEARLHMSLSGGGRKGIPLTKEHKNNIRKALKLKYINGELKVRDGINDGLIRWQAIHGSCWKGKSGDPLLLKVHAKSVETMKKEGTYKRMGIEHTRKYKSGEMENWQKGKTKETDEKIRKSGQKQSKHNRDNAFCHVGEKNNNLKIIGLKIKKDKYNCYSYLCRCDCGNLTEIKYYDFKNGGKKSCGCLGRWGNRHKWYFKKHNKDIKCRSGWEVLYANYLIKNNIRFGYEGRTFKLSKKRRYTPDFYLNDSNEYIELKGDTTSINAIKQKEKIEIFKLSHKISILHWDDIYKICNLPYKRYGDYFRKASKLKIKIEDYLGKMMYLKDRKAEVA